MNLSETAFVSPLDDVDAGRASRFSLRWFTPEAEVGLCGHATLATAAVLFQELSCAHKRVEFETRRSGSLFVQRSSDGSCAMDFPANPPRLVDMSEGGDPDAASPGAGAQRSAIRALLAVALGEPAGLGVDVAAVWFDPVMRKLLVELAEPAAATRLQALRVDAPALRRVDQDAVPDALRIRGVSLFALRLQGGAPALVSRYFAPWVGIDEDPVNGSSHTCLAPLVAAHAVRQLAASGGRGGDAPVEVSRSVDGDGRTVRFSVRFAAAMLSRRGGDLALSVQLSFAADALRACGGEVGADGSNPPDLALAAMTPAQVLAAAVCSRVSIGGHAAVVLSGELRC